MGFILLLVALLALTACGQETSIDRSSEEMSWVAARAAALRPTDVRLSEIYERSCISCHGVRGSGAPLTGDGIGWAPRLAKGETALVDSTIDGFRGMPPLGLCSDCSAQDFRLLIEFMSTDTNTPED